MNTYERKGWYIAGTTNADAPEKTTVYYFTEDTKGNEIRTPYPCYSVNEAREWFIACGIHMAIDPQPV